MKFEWDESKAAVNLRKHGVSFDEATTVFGAVLTAAKGRLIVVSHTDRGDRIRPISAREMTRRERRDYEQI